MKRGMFPLESGCANVLTVKFFLANVLPVKNVMLDACQ